MNPTPDSTTKARAILEAVLVLAGSIIAVVLVARSPLGHWERETLGRPFLTYLALAGIPLAAILLQGRPLQLYGLSRRGLDRQFDAAFRCLVPYAVGRALAFPLGPRQLPHALVEPVLAVAVVVVCARLLRPKDTGLAAAFLVPVPLLPRFAVGPLVFYPLFLAPAEELLFRGYIQSRLNVAFGRPFRVLGADVGWAVVMTALLFALFHVVSIPALVEGRLDLRWSAAAPTFAWGMALGYLRERTESLLTPILCHGVPQGIAWAFLGR